MGDDIMKLLGSCSGPRRWPDITGWTICGLAIAAMLGASTTLAEDTSDPRTGPTAAVERL